SEFNKKESNVGGGASLTANYPQGSTELGVGGIIPIKKNKYFGGAAGINVKQKIPTKWGTFTVKTGLKKGFNKNFNVKDFNFGVSFTKKI
ncbi:MAG: hypothetical protein GY777_00670, partial [Candidatus Brocadiaceae bacterium]|nr:hypothetical protein [Candidatus Brocadiaceae bacterium]